MNKQIEEIVEILQTSGAISYEPNAYRLPSERFIDKFFVTEREGRLTIDYGIFANAIINAGYRRQEDADGWKEIAETYQQMFENARTDVAREVIVTLEAMLEDNPISHWHKGYLTEISDIIRSLKKKYIGEKE